MSLSVSLLLLLSAVAVVYGQERMPSSTRSSRVIRTVPPLDGDQNGAVVFRLKETRPCECLNGGECHPRLRLCMCPLGFSGSRCERADEPFLAFAKQLADKAATTESSDDLVSQKVHFSQPAVRQLDLTEWLFYVPLFAATLLLFTLMRVFAILLKSYLSKEEKSLQVTVVARPLHDTDSNIYSVPLPIRPPPYSEKLSGASPFAHSTPFKSGCKLLQLQHESQSYLAVSHLDEYEVIV